ncbi:DUF3018 domain-containing protein [Gigaspora margarita]|uniref:DUF3018 domain-containing protein n=1 Tax=Gigaspora margarita TaxID=4874 RepID=A0A8H3WS89_GIGMA|nr:DUF3018 domain-containing protein [Gigaspora margarita]
MQTIQTSHRSSAPAMQKLRNQRRANGMRPIQIWVPDTRQPEFVSECQRQTRNIASNVTYEREIMDWIESTADTQGHIEDAPVFRVVIEPDKSNGISKLSQAMVDKIMPVRKEKISGIIGKINRKLMIKIESAIAIFYGIA